jgi:hypothetical protein
VALAEPVQVGHVDRIGEFCQRLSDEIRQSGPDQNVDRFSARHCHQADSTLTPSLGGHFERDFYVSVRPVICNASPGGGAHLMGAAAMGGQRPGRRRLHSPPSGVRPGHADPQGGNVLDGSVSVLAACGKPETEQPGSRIWGYLMPVPEALVRCPHLSLWEVEMTANCPDCGQQLRAYPEATSGLDQEYRVWPMMACLSCLDRGARGYWGRRSDGQTIPVRPLRY